jgi:hypothetical protein
MAEDTQPSVEAAWDAFTGGAEVTDETSETIAPEAVVDTEAISVDEQDADPIPDNDDDLLGSTTDFDSIRQEIAALKQQLEQERLNNQELIRRAQQSFRDQGASLLERVEQRLGPVQDTLVDLVKRQLLTPEDAQQRLQAMERQFRTEELQKDKQQREYALRQQWLATQQQAQPQQGQAPNQDAQTVQQQISALVTRYGLNAQDLRDAGAPDDLSHLSPVQALLVSQKWVVAAAKMKQARGGGNTPQQQRAGGKQFPYPDMGGGAGVPAKSMESITRELEAEMSKAYPDYDRIAELNNALTIPTQ